MHSIGDSWRSWPFFDRRRRRVPVERERRQDALRERELDDTLTRLAQAVDDIEKLSDEGREPDCG